MLWLVLVLIFELSLTCCPWFSIVPSVRCCNRTLNYATARFLQDPLLLKLKAVCSFELLGTGNPAVEFKLPRS